MGSECQQVHAAMREGRVANDSAVSQHAAGCPACAALLSGGVEMAHALDAAPAALPLDRLFAEVEATIARERGPIAWLRSRPVWVRVVLTAWVAGLIPLLVTLTWARPDRAVYPGQRLAIDLLVVLVPATLALAIAMRPLYRPAWPKAVEFVVLVLAVVAVLVGPMLVPAHHAHPDSLGGTGSDLVPRALACLVTGTVLGVPMLLWMRAIGRHPRRFGLPPGVAAVLAGLVGAVAVFLHCPLVAPQHLLLGHSMVLVMFVGMGLLAGLGQRS